MDASIRLGDVLTIGVTILGFLVHWAATSKRLAYWQGETSARLTAVEEDVEKIDKRVGHLERGGRPVALHS